MYSIPRDYRSCLEVRERERAIKTVKDDFESALADALNLQRVTAPLFLLKETGLNDDLNGVEKPVRFYATDIGKEVEVVQSLAKWKRHALHRYGFSPGEGLYTDMNAIRPDETLSPIHSLYVDQWDWEKVMKPNERNVEFLQATVESIYQALCQTEMNLARKFPQMTPVLPKTIQFVTSDELQKEFPNMTPRERENAYCEKHGAIFVIGIGGKLADGREHDGRAPDYDDWTTPRKDGGRGLNGDIIVWHPLLKRAFELSSMGIRVDAVSLKEQLGIRGCTERADLPFHRAVLDGTLPQTIGGGIGQSRLCMFLLKAVHIGEVACGLWPDKATEEYRKSGVVLL